MVTFLILYVLFNELYIYLPKNLFLKEIKIIKKYPQLENEQLYLPFELSME